MLAFILDIIRLQKGTYLMGEGRGGEGRGGEGGSQFIDKIWYKIWHNF